jgi:peptidoglycan hydrolase CwlO-like protein
MFKKYLFLFTAFLFLFLSPILLFADEQTDLENKLNELGKAKNTLSNQIKIINSQYDLTLLRITQTENSIKSLEREINDLASKITDLNGQLNILSSIYVLQIAQNYKLQKNVPPFAFLFSNDLNTYLQHYKYVSSVQKNSQNSLINMETVRVNYDTQKTQKAQKQQEMESLQQTLAAQKRSLDSQKSAKSQLLKSTEAEYERVQQQLSALKRFSLSAGGSSCLDAIPSGGSDGNFFSQRDPRWCKKYIGLSNDTVGEVGCYISSVSMLYKKINSSSSVTPLSYAADSTHFWGNTAYMTTPSVPEGYSYKQLPYSSSTIDKELSSGRYVIAQMKMSNIAGMHFVVITSGSAGSYKIHDPWFGADQNFSDRYSTAGIMSLRLITK